MKLKKYQEKKEKKKNIMLICIGVIVLLGISLLVYKTFAVFNEQVSFPFMKGKVDYYGNSDVYFAFYHDSEKLDSMPKKDNEDGLIYIDSNCDNEAIIEWDSERWAPTVLNLTKSKTKCTLYFGKLLELDKDVPIVTSGNGLYKVSHSVSEIDQEWNQTEYRYAGANPNNYVKFNNEIWRIIGLVNVKTENGVEQRIKIIRTNDVENQKSFEYGYSWDYKLNGVGSSIGNLGSNDWTDSQLKDMLNGIYYSSLSGECYKASSNPTMCDFTLEKGTPQGLNEIARKMVDKNVIWNLGGWENSKITANKFYEKERGINTGNSNRYSSEWTNLNDTKYHNGIGLIYPSDYGYAVGGNVREICLDANLYDYNNNDCRENDWLRTQQNNFLITSYSLSCDGVFAIDRIGLIDTSFSNVDDPATIEPALYLSKNVKIEKKLSDDYGSMNNPFTLFFYK